MSEECRQKILKYLNELIDYRNNEYMSMCEFNNFNSAQSDMYLKHTDDIQKLANQLQI